MTKGGVVVYEWGQASLSKLPRTPINRTPPMLHQLPAFLLAAFALAGSPGPNTLSLAATGAAFGVRGGLVYMVGLSLGVVLVMLLTASGVAGVLLALPGAAPVIGALAAVYFAWLAWRIATAPPIGSTGVKRRQPTFYGGMFLSLVNPKAYAAMAALFSGFVLIAGHLVMDVGAKLAVLFGVLVVVNVSWLSGGAALTRAFRDPRLSRLINVSFAVLLVASVAFALLAER